LYHQLFVLILNLLTFEGGQPAQLQIKDGLGLDFGQGEAFHQFGLRGVRVW